MGKDVYMLEDYYKWIIPNYKDKTIKDGCLRFEVAREEAKKKRIEINQIVAYVNEFLLALNMEVVEHPKIKFEGDFSKKLSELYKKVKEETGDKNNIVWIKFTIDGYLGVVATSADVNFNMDNTSGRIIGHVKKKWDESFVLIFPLKKIPKNLNRQLIESGIGNYLISKNVPILDFYSHNL